MKKLYLLLVFLFSFGTVFAQQELSKEEQERRERNIQAGNPFAKFGYKAKVATLSKGKYLEVHDLDSIVTIGSVRYHVDNKKIVGFIPKDTTGNMYARPTMDTPSRWLSPDPLMEEFPDWSPYNYVLNNPLRYTDPTGLAPEECCPDLVKAFKGIYGTVKSEVVGTYDFITSDAYKAETWKGMGNFFLGAMVTSGPGANMINTYTLDQKLGTNTVGAMEGYYQAMDNFYSDLTGGDVEKTAGAITSLALIAAPSKLDDLARISKVSKMSDFFTKTDFGKSIDKFSNKTNYKYQGQSIYQVNKKVEGMRKGDFYYLDNLHKDHIEIFNSQGHFRETRNLNGTINEAKTKIGLEQSRTIKL